ncbi:MAG: hypothetical protein PHP03_02820 [Candidatus Pacebacteria bacterium]|nr:hypothetical protein [Candidatus Paceibacterota bacterium]
MSTLFFVLAVVSAVVIQGIKKIKVDPPTIAVVTFKGKIIEIGKDSNGNPISKTKKGGWRWFFLYPIVFSYINIDVARKNSTEKEITPQKVRTPDGAELLVPIEVTWTPTEGKEIEYIKSKKEAGVWSILSGIIQQRLREWAMSTSEGPQNAKDLLRAGDEAVAVLVKAVAGSTLSQIPSDIPTPILLRYFRAQRPKPREDEKEITGEKWEKLDKYFKKNPKEKQKVKTAIEERQKAVNEIKSGNGKHQIDHLGITINRFNIGEIKALGKYAESLDLEVKEKNEKEAEEVEVNHSIKQIKKIETELKIPVGEAKEFFQTERSKTPKTIQEHKINLSPETREMVKEVLKEAIPAIFGKSGG